MRKFLILLLLLASGHVFAQTADVYQKAADGYLDDKNYQAAFDNYTKAIKKNDYDKTKLSGLYYKRGESLDGLEKYDDAVKDYTTAINLNPLNSDAYWGRGVIYDNRRSGMLAIADYTKAISLLKGSNENENLATLYANLANIHYQLKHFPEALEADSISLSLNDQYSRAYKIKGNVDYELKNFDQAIKDFTQAIFTYTDDDKEELSLIYSFRADAKRMSKKYKDAINDYSLAININADNAHAYWNRAATYNSNKDYQLAADDYTKAMTYFKDDSTLSKLYEDRARNEIGQTLYDKAIQDDSVAISLNPANKSAYIDKAGAYTQTADYGQSINTLNKLMPLFIGQNKILSILQFEIANNEYFLNEFDKVVASCTKAIELNQNYSSPYYCRAKVYLKKMNNKQLAMNDFNKVTQLDTTKKTIDYIFSLFYVGRGDEAVGILQNNLISTTDNALILSDYYNLACLYALMNKPDEANIYLKKAIDNGYVKKYAVADEDLDNIRNTDDYKTTMGIDKSQ